MEEELTERHASVSLYHYTCQRITGYEDAVMTKRLFNVIHEKFESNKHYKLIISGSFGEGLEMEGSDKDFMLVKQSHCVYADLNDIHSIEFDKSYFITIMDNTQPGYTLLKLVKYDHDPDINVCVSIGDEFYLSNWKFKQNILEHYVSSYTIFNTIHGPCISDENYMNDFAYCLHSKKWLPPAKDWITRNNVGWPDLGLKSKIVDHGILFFPIGTKGSTMEDLEWRLSFSVGERMLIYSFRHTQLLCYALMKIFLKDVLELDIECKGLLCSYHLKTIIFWISEELPQSIFNLGNLTICLMACLRRLVYFIRQATCPHYFIPSNNLFRQIKDHQRYRLLNQLDCLLAMGWRCLFLSEKLPFREIISPHTFDLAKSKTKYYLDVLNSAVLYGRWKSYPELQLYNILHCTSNKLKAHFKYFMPVFGRKTDQSDNYVHMNENKGRYRQHKTNMAYILLNLFNGAMSEWLTLASYFYTTKQYYSALFVLSYFLSFEENFYPILDFKSALIDSSFQYKRFLLMLRAKYKGLAKCASSEYSFIPTELDFSNESLKIPPTPFSLFLRFLCLYRQKITI